jgi:hypothetical protein
MNILSIESLCPQKPHNRTLLFARTLFKHSRYFDYWNQALNMCMRVCYLDCHEAGLCCYLVIHIEALLFPLQLFYFHLCPIYWLSFLVACLTMCVGLLTPSCPPKNPLWSSHSTYCTFLWEDLFWLSWTPDGTQACRLSPPGSSAEHRIFVYGTMIRAILLLRMLSRLHSL